MHFSMGLTVHFAVSDNKGNSVVIEYMGNEMYVTPTPAVTNFYLTPGDKYGIGTAQSHSRYEILTEALRDKPTMTENEVMGLLDRVSKDNFNDSATTEWSIVYDQNNKRARLCHRENYKESYLFELSTKDE